MKKLRKKNGFTLLEVLVALVITVAAGILLSNAWSGNFLRVRKTALYNNIAILLERKMVEIEAKYQGKPILDIKDEEGDFGDQYPQYRWNFTVQPMEMPDLAPLIQAGKTEGTDEMLLTMMGKMREIVNKSIAEGKVTVSVNSNGKELKFTVTTYFVDYNADVAVGL